MYKGEKQKGRGYWLAAILLVVAILLAGCKEENTKETAAPNTAGTKTTETTTTDKPSEKVNFIPTEYDADIEVNVEDKTVSGVLKVKATNYTGKQQDKIFFHVYPNQFREGVDLLGGFWKQIIDENSQPGTFDLSEVMVNGKSNNHVLKDTIVEIPLEDWKRDETIDLELKFSMKIPKNNGRLSYDDNAIWMGNWLPIQAVYDERGWVTDPYHSIGDPFYSHVGKYNVKVNVPASYKIATTGKEKDAVVEQDGSLSFSTEIENVRDFAMVIMDENYQKQTQERNGVTVNTWYLASENQEAAKQNQQAGIDALAYFGKQYGAYPYQEFDIVRTGMFTAMEFPGLIYLTENDFASVENGGFGAVVHETAHQWWYGMVGNDEVRDPWLDEGLTTYSTTRFFLENNPDLGNSQLDFRKTMLREVETFERQSKFISSPVNEFTNIGTYSMLVYQKGALMLDNLEKEIGKEKMDQLLQAYFKEYQFKTASPRDFVAVFEEELGPEAREYFLKWLKGEEPEFKK